MQGLAFYIGYAVFVVLHAMPRVPVLLRVLGCQHVPPDMWHAFCFAQACFSTTVRTFLARSRCVPRVLDLQACAGLFGPV